MSGVGAGAPDVAAVILAGGRSTRMGRDKAFIDVGGQTLLDRTVAVALEVAAEAIVALSPSQPDLQAAPRVFVVRDAVTHAGPLAALGPVLAQVRAPKVLLLATDHPALEAAVLRRFVALLTPDVEAAARPGEPFLAAYRTEALARAATTLTAAGEARLRALLASLRPREVSREDLLADPEVSRLDPALASLLDADTPAALERAGSS